MSLSRAVEILSSASRVGREVRERAGNGTLERALCHLKGDRHVVCLSFCLSNYSPLKCSIMKCYDITDHVFPVYSIMKIQFHLKLEHILSYVEATMLDSCKMIQARL